MGSEPIYNNKGLIVYQGDCLKVMQELPEASVHMCVTSPPYWGLRDYGVEGQLGLEDTPQEYVEKLVIIFREVRRVLRDDGTVWLNLGDTYAANRSYQVDGTKQTPSSQPGRGSTVPPGLKPKDLIGIPWRAAFALQADGWYLRSDVIWEKPNIMPESARDRPTRAHEYLFLLSKNQRYYYDSEAIKDRQWDQSRNRRTVWSIPTSPIPEAHFATFPPKLIEPCIQAGTSEKGCCRRCGAPQKRVVQKGEDGTEPQTIDWKPSCSCDAGKPVPGVVLDPFLGSGTTACVCYHLYKRCVGIELKAEYADIAVCRIKGVAADSLIPSLWPLKSHDYNL